jgi:hypothetical protein
VYCYAKSVPATESNAFADSYIEYATLHVPTTSIDAYKAAAPWSEFKTFMGLDDSSIKGDVNGDGKVDVSDVVGTVNIILQKQ